MHEWPREAFKQATLIARCLLEATGGERTAARAQLASLIGAMVLPSTPGDDVTALADQIMGRRRRFIIICATARIVGQHSAQVLRPVASR